VLDYFLNDETLLVAFTTESGIEPEAVAQARASMDD
jgi:hypothetical protein